MLKKQHFLIITLVIGKKQVPLILLQKGKWPPEALSILVGTLRSVCQGLRARGKDNERG